MPNLICEICGSDNDVRICVSRAHIKEFHGEGNELALCKGCRREFGYAPKTIVKRRMRRPQPNPADFIRVL